MITYNSDLFVWLFAVYSFFNGLAWAYTSYTNDGEPRKWNTIGVLDGIALVVISALPVFF